MAAGGVLSISLPSPVAPAEFHEPARPMPVATEIGRQVGDDDEVTLAGLDEAVAPGTQVPLGGRIGLNDRNGFYPEIAHSTRATTTSTTPATMAMSSTSLSCGRNGLKPKQIHKRMC